MQNNRFFMIVSGAISACVLLVALFALTVLDIAFDSTTSAWVILSAVLVGAAQIYCFYDIFISGRASTLLLPYKLLLITITHIFTAVQLLLLARLDLSGAFVILVLLACVLYVAVYAVVVYISGVVIRQQAHDEVRKVIELNLANRITETMHVYRQFAALHKQLNFGEANRLVDTLALKARAIRGLGDSGYADMEHRIMIACDELLVLFDKSRTEPVDQRCADDVGNRFKAILSEFLLLDRAMIK